MINWGKIEISFMLYPILFRLGSCLWGRYPFKYRTQDFTNNSSYSVNSLKNQIDNSFYFSDEQGAQEIITNKDNLLSSLVTYLNQNFVLRDSYRQEAFSNHFEMSLKSTIDDFVEQNQ